MQKIQKLWHEIVKNQNLIDALFSNVRNKQETPYHQVKIKPVLIKNELYYHIEYIFPTKVIHENILPQALAEHMAPLSMAMKQLNIYTEDKDYQVLISKRLKVTVIEKKPTKEKEEVSLSHNRKKNYVFQEGIPVPFLVELGIMSKEGNVISKGYDKFRQINRFVEMVRDVSNDLPVNKKLRIISSILAVVSLILHLPSITILQSFAIGILK